MLLFYGMKLFTFFEDYLCGLLLLLLLCGLVIYAASIFCFLVWQIAEHLFPAALSLLFKLHTCTDFSYVSNTDCARPHYTYLSALLSLFLHMPCGHFAHRSI